MCIGKIDITKTIVEKFEQDSGKNQRERIVLVSHAN